MALLIPAAFGCYFILNNHYSIESHRYFLYTSLVHAIYFVTLANAYKFADLSFVYPYARGVGTIVATTGGILLLGDRPSVIGIWGICLTLLGTLIEPLGKLKNKGKAESLKGIAYTLLTGVMIGSYLVLDTKGIRTVENSYEYVAIMFFYSSLMMAPMLLKGDRLKQELQHSRHLPFVGCAFMAGAYAIILLAMQTTEVSYTVSARASGIILSGFYGKFVFKEVVGKLRISAIVLILIGVVCLAYA
ncbi:MAG: hypothetical protein OHK0056_24220 [Bacteriovoracaceae bacterium]